MSESSCDLSDEEEDELQYGLDKIAETMWEDPDNEKFVRDSFKRLKKLNPQKFGKYVDKLLKAMDDINSVWKEMGDVFDVGEYRERRLKRTNESLKM